MKKLTTVLLGTALASTTLLAQPKTFQVEAQVSSVNLESVSDTAPGIKLRIGDRKGFSLDFGYSEGSKLAITEFAGVYNWQVNDSFLAGANLTVVGVNFSDNNDFSSSALSGVLYGAQGRYLLTENQTITLEYKTGSVTDSAGIVDFDMDMAILSYGFKF